MRPSCPPRPTCMESQALLPMQSPIRTEERNVIRVYEDPTAARTATPCQNRHPGIPAHNERIYHIVQLLEHIPGHKGKSKKENLFTYGSSCKINLHAQNLLVGKKQE